jgi:hypothetical protein
MLTPPHRALSLAQPRELRALSRDGPQRRLTLDSGFTSMVLMTKSACDELRLPVGERGRPQSKLLRFIPSPHALEAEGFSPHMGIDALGSACGPLLADFWPGMNLIVEDV